MSNEHKVMEHKVQTKRKPGPPTWAERQGNPRLCSAHRQRDGERCGAWAIRGSNVCRIHGGAAKQVRRKAQARLDFAKDMLMLRAFKGLPPPEPPPKQPKPKPTRRATRPAGPPGNPAEPRAEAPAEAPAEELPTPPPVPTRERADAPTLLASAEPPPAALKALTSAEEAIADVARANRAARGSHKRRKRR